MLKQNHGRRVRRAAIGALALVIMLPLAATAQIVAQFDSGSDGSDGALAPQAPLTGTQTVVIDMADHPDGVYQYTSVNIPAGIIVQFTPNAKNTPVTWLVQDTCVIGGVVDLSGLTYSGQYPGRGGAGGFAGGYGGNSGGPDFSAGNGEGPGGGPAPGGTAGYATSGYTGYSLSGPTYGNRFLLPLVGGSGGAGTAGTAGAAGSGGSGGGGAILLAVTNTLTINGTLKANGGLGPSSGVYGNGSGGGIRLVSSSLVGSGTVRATPESDVNYGKGWIRVEMYDKTGWSGTIQGQTSYDYPGILVLPANVLPAMAITNIAGLAVPTQPTGSVLTPDVTIPDTQANPMAVAVACTNIPLSTVITLSVKPKFGALIEQVQANVGSDSTSSTATFSIDLPPGDGTMQARAVANISGAKAVGRSARAVSATGLAPNGERLASMEISSTLGGSQELVFVTESGVRFTLPHGAKS